MNTEEKEPKLIVQSDSRKVFFFFGWTWVTVLPWTEFMSPGWWPFSWWSSDRPSGGLEVVLESRGSRGGRGRGWGWWWIGRRHAMGNVDHGDGQQFTMTKAVGRGREACRSRDETNTLGRRRSLVGGFWRRFLIRRCWFFLLLPAFSRVLAAILLLVREFFNKKKLR